MSSKIATCLRFASIMGLLAGIGLAQAETPDFTGIWTNYAGGPRGRGGAGDDLPLSEEARAKIAEYRSLVSPLGETPGGYCLGTGMPGSMLGSGGYPMEVIQRPDQITIIYEAHNEIRRVYFGDRIIPEGDRVPRTQRVLHRPLGRGHADCADHPSEGTGEPALSPTAIDARIVERYTLTEEDGRKVLTAEMTMTDPDFYTEPVSDMKKWSIVPNGFLMTYECNEPIWHNRLEELRVATETSTQ